MTPDNSFFYYTAYGATIVIYIGYTASIWLRRRTLREKNRGNR